MKQSQHTESVLAETLLAGRAAAVMDPGIAAQPRGDGPGASEDAATASARGLCPAVHDAGISRVVTTPTSSTVAGTTRRTQGTNGAEIRAP